jgi:hypothetical protein
MQNETAPETVHVFQVHSVVKQRIYTDIGYFLEYGTYQVNVWLKVR